MRLRLLGRPGRRAASASRGHAAGGQPEAAERSDQPSGPATRMSLHIRHLGDVHFDNITAVRAIRDESSWRALLSCDTGSGISTSSTQLTMQVVLLSYTWTAVHRQGTHSKDGSALLVSKVQNL